MHAVECVRWHVCSFSSGIPYCGLIYLTRLILALDVLRSHTCTCCQEHFNLIDCSHIISRKVNNMMPLQYIITTQVDLSNCSKKMCIQL